MICILNFAIKYCPNCGEDLSAWGREHDYKVNCAFTCGCGLHFQKAATAFILEAADKSGGDMTTFEWAKAL